MGFGGQRQDTVGSDVSLADREVDLAEFQQKLAWGALALTQQRNSWTGSNFCASTFTGLLSMKHIYLQLSLRWQATGSENVGHFFFCRSMRGTNSDEALEKHTDEQNKYLLQLCTAKTTNLVCLVISHKYLITLNIRQNHIQSGISVGYRNCSSINFNCFIWFWIRIYSRVY